jgi:hypothetical protein
VRASTASVFTRAAAIAFVRQRMREVQLVPLGLEQVSKPLPPQSAAALKQRKVESAKALCELRSSLGRPASA